MRPDDPRPLPFYIRVTIAGLVVVTLVLLFHLGLSILQGTPGDLTFIAPFAFLSMLAAGFVWKLGRKTALVASIFAALMLILNTLFLVFPLTHPDSFFDFSISLVVVTGLLIAAVGGAVAYVQLGRGAARETATPVEVRAFGAIALAVVVSTLVIAALFQPIRRRAQDWIDRRFYRQKYDSAKTLATFSATLRDQVDLNHLREALTSVVEETMKPAYVSMWLRESESETGRSRRS